MTFKMILQLVSLSKFSSPLAVSLAFIPPNKQAKKDAEVLITQ
jgi:hypothetical protein